MSAVQIPQSTSRVVMLKLFTTGTTTAATGKTLAVQISKAGAAFGNPNAGATNATEVSNGWYKVTLDSTDTGTLGDLVVRGTATGCDDSERVFAVVKATTGGLTALPDTAVATNASLLTSGTGADQLSVSSGKVLLQATQAGVTIPTVTTVTDRVTANTDQLAGQTVTAAAGVTFPTSVGTSTYAGGDTAGTTTLLSRVTAAVALAGSAPSWYTAPVDVSTNVSAIKAKTDNLPAAPAAVGDIPTAVQNADALLGRNVAGGSSTGRTVSQALFALRNKVSISGTTMTVYSTDDTTSSWTATLTTDAAADPITAVDPG